MAMGVVAAVPPTLDGAEAFPEVAERPAVDPDRGAQGAQVARLTVAVIVPVPVFGATA